jgi:predicted transcriptional regulator
MTGIELRAARRRLLLTQTHLANLLDVSRPTISYYETGHARVPRTVELAIEALLYRSRLPPVLGYDRADTAA